MGVLTISCFSAICLVSAFALQNQAHFVIVEGKKVVNATKTIQGVSQISCVAYCLSLVGNGVCKVADYHGGSGDCHLSNQMDADVENATEEWKLLIPETGMMGIYKYFIGNVHFKVVLHVSYLMFTLVNCFKIVLSYSENTKTSKNYVSFIS